MIAFIVMGACALIAAALIFAEWRGDRAFEARETARRAEIAATTERALVADANRTAFDKLGGTR